MATRAEDRTITDAEDTLVAALRYHRYQQEAYAEHGLTKADLDSVRFHFGRAMQCQRALAALVGTVAADREDAAAVELARRRVHGE